MVNQSFLSSIGRAGAGIAVAFAIIASFTMTSGVAVNHDRLLMVIRAALQDDALPYARLRNEDYFTECAMLEMQLLRADNVFRNAIETRLVLVPDQHPCQSLRVMATGSSEDRQTWPAPHSYDNYAYGSRHLEALVLSVIDFSTAQIVYRWLSYGSVALLFLAMIGRSYREALLLAPVPLFLAFCFAMPVFGHNLAHAPGFFIGFFALSAFVAFPAIFGAASVRLAFFLTLGVLVADFDLLQGPIPAFLSLAIVLDHFFYSSNATVRSALVWVVKIAACFVIGYVTLTTVRLGLLTLYGHNLNEFYSPLLFRLGSVSDSGAVVGLRDNLANLWRARNQLIPGNAVLVTWLFIGSGAAWLFALMVWTVLAPRDRGALTRLSVDILVLAAASAGILAWYWLFAGHTYQHVLFMVRIAALPAAYGYVAALLAAREINKNRYGNALAAVIGVAAILIAVITIHPVWYQGLAPKITMARFIDAQADIVSCQSLGLHPDGKPDGIVEFSFEPAPPPPLAYIGVPGDHEIYIRLDRLNPGGAYDTGSALYILAIAERPGGRPVNDPDGRYIVRAHDPHHLYAHFCWDGHDTPESVYQFSIDGAAVPLLRN